MSLLKLYFIFVKIGAILLGGGYVILPILMDEFTEKRRILEKDELINYFALSQSLPGIIAGNMSIFIGYKLCGKYGAVLAMLGVITVPFAIIVLMASILGHFINNIYVLSVLWGIGIAVIALIILTIREAWVNSKRDLGFYLIYSFALIELLVFKLSPIQTIVTVVTAVLLINHINTRRRAK